MQDMEKKRARNREYMRSYSKRPEVQARQREYLKAYYEKTRDKQYAQQRAKRTGSGKAAYLSYMREYHAKNADRLRDYIRRYRTDNAAVLNENNRRYHAANKAKCNARNRQWVQEHPESNRRQAHLRRAAQHDAPGHYSIEALKQRYAFHGNKCVYCGSPEQLETDHMIPLARGGSNWPSNLVPSCRKCNRKKQRRTFFEFKRIIAISRTCSTNS